MPSHDPYSKCLSLLFSFFVLTLPFLGAPAPQGHPTAAVVSAQRADDHVPVASRLSELIAREVEQKQIPSVYITLVDHRGIVWKSAFGFADEERKIPARTDAVHRIASVSKLFTDIAIMQLAERGEVDIDADITRYVPEFRPHNPSGKPITLRQLMAHRSGLVREPPVGNYFDPSEPNLEETVQSLNRTSLVYEPGQRYKYSNAAIALAGYVVERVTGQPFARYVQEHILMPLGMESSSFVARTDLVERVPRAVLWTYDGRRMNVPAFQFGMAPAANMYSTLDDLSKFIVALFEGGEGEQGRILQRATLEAMWKPQFVSATQRTGVGIGFFVGEVDGFRRVGHSGDVYGFATEFAVLPEAKLGVVVVNTMNAANAWSERIATHALRLMLAQRAGTTMPDVPITKDVEQRWLKHLPGRYRGKTSEASFIRRNRKLYVEFGSTRSEVRQFRNRLIVDDLIAYGTSIIPLPDGIVIGSDTLRRVDEARPAAIPERWRGLVGEYGWDHNTLYILEHRGTLHALIEWYFSYPLKEISRDEFAFPDYGLYHGERLLFTRDTLDRAMHVVAAGVLFQRREIEGEEGKPFRIVPVRPVEVLKSEAAAASPPHEQGEFLEPELVELVRLDSTLRLDIRYAMTDNFMGAVFYEQPRAFLQRPAAEALVRVHRALKEQGYGILVHDAYRPWYVTKMFWEATPEHQKHFVADPSRGSRHNRGCAVDVTLYNLETGEPVEMVSGYDEFTPRAFPDYPGGTSLQRWHRELLRKAMEQEGFRVYDWEWWHFDYKDWERYPLMNVDFHQLR